MSSTPSDEIPDSLFQYLKEEYHDDPAEWALAISKFFDCLAADMKHVKCAQGHEAPESPLRSFHRVAFLLKNLSTDPAMVDEVRGLANISFRRDEEVSASANPLSEAALSEVSTAEVKLDMDDPFVDSTTSKPTPQTSTSSFSFTAKGLFSIFVTENTPVSAVDNMTLSGTGPATIEVFVTKTVAEDASVATSSEGSSNFNVPTGFGPEPENMPLFSLFDE